MAYDLIKISALPAATPDESQEIVVGVGDLAKRINYGDVKADMVGTSPSYTTDTEPYLMRQTANIGVVGKCALNKLVGGSLGWNQLANPQATTQAGVTITVSNGTVTINGTATANIYYQVTPTTMTVDGHVYFVKKEQNKTVQEITWYNDNKGIYLDTANDVGIQKATGAGRLYIRITSGAQVDAYVAKPQFIDLTATFGSTIADYVYGLESATAGAGVAWLSKYIDLGTYHAYDSGSIQSVQATAHVTTGFNQWDEVWELGGLTDQGALYPNTDRIRSKNYIPILPNTDYYFTYTGTESPTFGVCYYDGNKNFVGSRITFLKNNIRTSLANAAYMKFYIYNASPNITTYANNICINISKTTGSPKNGDYVPYSGHTYPLGSDTLRGIPQLVSNKLSYDGDEKYPDGTIKRKYGSRAYQSGDTSDGATMITDGTTTVYKLATPTTESSTSYQKVQTIDADGTESFTVSNPVPVGHETQTPDNVLAALGWLGE